MELGAKIKDLRVKNGLTQQELADRTELSKGYISQLETEVTSPSIATLADILQCLGTTLGEFFSNEPSRQVVFAENDMFVSKNDDVTVTWLVPDSQRNDMEPILVELEEGAKTAPHSPHSGEEWGYVLDGIATLHIGDRTYVVKKNMSFYFEAEKPHFIENRHKRPLKLVWVSTPPSF
ncbi:MAG: helix-turn-helix transcriptional regulator [Clostridia bacterium]|nr:helix-turn-helix transcriptional regulator [Clostridia bacterium]